MFKLVRCTLKAACVLGLVFGLMWGMSACTSSSDGSDSAGGTTDDETTEGITAGTLTGYAFTVIDGVVFQEEEDGPISGGENGGMIAFDESIYDLANDESEATAMATVTLEDGGFGTYAAYGTVEDAFANSLVARLNRDEDIEFTGDYVFGLNTIDETPGVIDPIPADPDGEFYFTGEYGTGGYAGLMNPNVEEPGTSCDDPEGTQFGLDTPNGESLGVLLFKMTMLDIVIAGPFPEPGEC